MFHIFCWNRLNILVGMILSILEIIDFFTIHDREIRRNNRWKRFSFPFNIGMKEKDDVLICLRIAVVSTTDSDYLTDAIGLNEDDQRAFIRRGRFYFYPRVEQK